MRKIFLFPLLFSSLISTGQLPLNESLTSDHYLRKSRNQKTSAFVLVTAGTVLTTVSLSMSLSNLSSLFDANDDTYYSGTTIDVLGYTGLGLIAGSVPLFIYARKNRKKAMSMQLGYQSNFLQQKHTQLLLAPPTVKFKIQL